MHFKECIGSVLKIFSYSSDQDVIILLLTLCFELTLET
mgnify:CR=1 FL=1